MVSPTPLSLATTRRISVDFFSSGYLDVSVPRVPHVTLWIYVTFHGSSPWGFPHSEIHGSKLICSSPWLIAACRVLHRLLMPRHSPCALIRLNFLIDLWSMLFSELLEFHKQIFIGIHIAVKRFSFYLLSWIISTFRWNCIYPFLERPNFLWLLLISNNFVL